MTSRAATLALLAGLAIASLSQPQAALAQTSQGKVDIEADSMELFEEKNEAIFRGNVKASRRDVKFSAGTLLVKFAKDGAGKSEITWLETAGGGVQIVTPTQVINGDWMKMNVKANTAVVGGGVTVKQGTSVVSGDKLDVNLNTNESKFSGGRVRGSFIPD
ncbi:MAG: LptA/OstA family protein [Anderseniella sp.]|jgi:lipopolysaccharide export system protein LptA|nr:LptA/OstA family protein [Anderseniella sp.]